MTAFSRKWVRDAGKPSSRSRAITFAGDGGDEGQVAGAPDGKLIYLFRPKLIPNRGIQDGRFVNPGVLRAERLVNLVRGWEHEIKDVMGAMGINAIESLRGNRERLRGLGLDSETLRTLGVKPAGASMG